MRRFRLSGRPRKLAGKFLHDNRSRRNDLRDPSICRIYFPQFTRMRGRTFACVSRVKWSPPLAHPFSTPFSPSLCLPFLPFSLFMYLSVYLFFPPFLSPKRRRCLSDGACFWEAAASIGRRVARATFHGSSLAIVKTGSCLELQTVPPTVFGERAPRFILPRPVRHSRCENTSRMYYDKAFRADAYTTWRATPDTHIIAARSTAIALFTAPYIAVTELLTLACWRKKTWFKVTFFREKSIMFWID